MRGHSPRRARRTLACLTTALTATAALAAVSSANQMTVFSCHDPAGNAVGHDGWSIERTADLFIKLTDTCGPSGNGALTAELGANGAGYPGSARGEWTFRAPAWASIASYEMDIAGSYGIPGGIPVGSGQAFIDASDESDPIYDYRNLGAGAIGGYRLSRTPPAPVSWITMNASCDGQGGPCPAGPVISRIELGSSAIVLDDSTTPTVTAVAGSLVGGAPVSGTGEVSFNASDTGPGVYSGALVIDGHPEAAQVLNPNNGWCQDLGQTANGTRSFAHPDPCPQSTSGTLTFDSTSVPDGQHTLKLLVDDASGNTTTGYNATLTTNNAPANTAAPQILAPPQVLAGTVLTAQAGSWSAPTGAGTITYGYQWQRCDSAGNGCTAIPAAQSATYIPIATDTGRTLRVLVNASDNDGLAGAVSPASATVAAGSAGDVAGFTASGTGAPNGAGASASAQVRLAGRPAISRPFAQRAIKLAGQLLDSQQHPIAGATLDVLSQSATDSAARLIGHAVTRSDGSFLAVVAGGPSRVIRVAYRAFSGDVGYAADAQLRESVGAGVHLNVSPAQTGSAGTIRLSGAVSGPVPRQGVVVDLLVHYRGQWEPFRTPRTDAGGRFSVAYQFQGSVGRFPFRAAVLGGQSGFPYAGGESRPVYVTTR